MLVSPHASLTLGLQMAAACLGMASFSDLPAWCAPALPDARVPAWTPLGRKFSHRGIKYAI